LGIDAKHILVIAPHPDDETFGCGGLIATAATAGASVTVVTATDGAASHPGHPDLADTRRREQRAAAEALGCARPPTWLGLPDGALAEHEDELGDAIATMATEVDLIVAPWPGDGHPDHEAAGRAALRSAAATGVRAIAYPVWVWRWGGPADLAGEPWRRLDLGPRAHRAKKTAMKQYPSQTTDLLGETIVDEAMMQRFALPFEIYADV
jgi:LmbE family N-acetylglucosaminyl deacetylase